MAPDKALTYAAGEIIVKEGDPGDCMYVVLTGRAGLELPSGGHAEFGPGNFFGEMSVIDTQLRSATVRALENDTRALPIDQARFIYLVSQQPVFALSIMAGLSQRLRGIDNFSPPPRTDREHEFTPVEIKPGLWQLRSRSKACNVYLLAGRNRTVLVDTGMSSSFDALETALRTVGRAPTDIDLIVLTHEHTDHVGGAAMLQGRPMIAAHPMAANKIELQDAFSMLSGVIGEDVKAFTVDLRLPEGAVIEAAPYRFDVLYTPGHTSSCISLADPAQDILISGDLLMSGGAMGGIFGSGSISDYTMSLKRLERLGLTNVLPGHGRASANGKEDAAVAVTRAKALLNDTRELFQAMGEDTVFDRILNSLRDLNR